MTDEEKNTNEEQRPKKRGKRRPRKYGSGSVFRRLDRKGKQWVAQVFLENGKTKQRYFNTEKEASDALNEMLYELLSLQRLSARDLDALYARKLEEGLSPIRIRSIHIVIRMALKQAIRWRLISRNVSDDVSPPRDTQPHERQTLTPEQARKLLAAAKGHRLEAILTLALATGMRRGELLALRWKEIDFERKSLYVRRSVNRLPGGYCETEPKTASSKRHITLPQFVIEALQQHRIRQKEARLKAGPTWEENDLVFCNIYGRFLNSQSLFVLFSSLLEKAELPHMRFHDLRHSAATILLAMGVSAKVVQELLGHSNITMTLNVYGHVLPSMQQEAMNRLDHLYGGKEDEEEDQAGGQDIGQK